LLLGRAEGSERRGSGLGSITRGLITGRSDERALGWRSGEDGRL
jgi:hypothetical protein